LAIITTEVKTGLFATVG